MKTSIAVIRGDGIGGDCIDAGLAVMEKALLLSGLPTPECISLDAGAAYFTETGCDIEKGGEERAGQADAIFLGAIGLPKIRYQDGTEISPHLRLRDQYGLYAGVRPVRAFPNVPPKLVAPEAAKIDLVLIRESTEGLFYSAAVHARSKVEGDDAVEEMLRITRSTSERLHHFAFRLAEKRKNLGKGHSVTCVDKANVFRAFAFFRKIFDEVAENYPAIPRLYSYVDAMALELIRKPWRFDVLVTENMFGDILSDLAAGLVGGMGMAPCAEIGDHTGLFQPAHGSAPDIMGQDKANPIATILSAGLLLDYLAEKSGHAGFAEAAVRIERAVESGFASHELRPIEFGGNMGTKAMTKAILNHLT
ncbi:isocitrate/isopropylmalate dehydrogenase family protein [Alphaproteobacteria bacterium LSUCC0684]